MIAANPMAFLARLKERARRVKTEMIALALAARHPGTPWYAKLILAAVVLYALTPVDLIPDFVPLIGLLDDLVFVGLAVAFAARFVPAAVLAECRERAKSIALSPRRNRFAYLFAVALWSTLLVVAAVLVYRNYAA